jgi:hypothetical protein
MESADAMSDSQAVVVAAVIAAESAPRLRIPRTTRRCRRCARFVLSMPCHRSGARGSEGAAASGSWQLDRNYKQPSIMRVDPRQNFIDSPIVHARSAGSLLAPHDTAESICTASRSK